MLKAKIAIVKVGTTEFEGLRGDDGLDYIGVSQLAELFSIDRNQASRTLKRLLGNDCSIDQATTDLHSNPVNVLPANTIGVVALKLAMRGHQQAALLAEKILVAGIATFYAAAFKDANPAEKAQQAAENQEARQEARLETFGVREAFFEAIRAKVKLPELLKTSVACTELLNLAVIGSDSVTFRNFHRLREYDTAIAETYTRNYFNEKALNRVRQIEEHATVKINKGMAPLEAVKAAIDFYEITPDDSWRSTLWSFQDPDKTPAKA